MAGGKRLDRQEKSNREAGGEIRRAGWDAVKASPKGRKAVLEA
jgi:hypothetical protein